MEDLNFEMKVEGARFLKEKTPVGILAMTFFVMALISLALAVLMEYGCKNPFSKKVSSDEVDGETEEDKVEARKSKRTEVNRSQATANPLFDNSDTVDP